MTIIRKQRTRRRILRAFLKNQRKKSEKINISHNFSFIFSGLIQINNWKPLAFEAITDNSEEPIANLFRDIAANIQLKILTKRFLFFQNCFFSFLKLFSQKFIGQRFNFVFVFSSPNDPSHSQCIINLKQRLLKVAIDKQPDNLLTTVDNQQIKVRMYKRLHCCWWRFWVKKLRFERFDPFPPKIISFINFSFFSGRVLFFIIYF